MRITTTMLATALAAALTLGLGVVGADAATRSFKDSRSDGYGHYNITRVTGTNAAKRFVTRVRYKNLPRGWAGWTQIFLKRSGNYGAMMQVRRKRSGGYRVRLWDGDSHRIRCRGLHGRYNTRRDRLRASIPQRCIPGRPRAWRLYVYGGDARATHADDWTRTGPRIPYR